MAYLSKLLLFSYYFVSSANGSAKIVTPLVEFIHQRRLEREKYREEKKEERRRKEMEKKKSRDVERMKKRDVRKEKEERKADRNSKDANKFKKEDDRPLIKVFLLNILISIGI